MMTLSIFGLSYAVENRFPTIVLFMVRPVNPPGATFPVIVLCSSVELNGWLLKVGKQHF
ncbi:hypothetical protein [Klebsiella sp. BIGb0407]|uniref:hypothetical protein n=1 Tax=Klebsiella sp. BIGb0407 TaxID=2940603 RepID=UPI002169C468|nr:hypothetical protein [Klebsiella sp. BIGb0407]MCS3430235.1 hypothetical protein [Klebsiella sp. BIGb0407]